MCMPAFQNALAHAILDSYLPVCEPSRCQRLVWGVYSRLKRGEEQGSRPEPSFGGADDDMPPPFLPSAAELGLSLPEDKPNFRK